MVVTTVVLGGLLPRSASASVIEPVVDQNVSAVSEHLGRGGGASVPGLGCGATCNDWWRAEHEPIPGQASSETLWKELNGLRQATGVLPKASRVLGVIGLAVGSFDVGWKIGSGINAKLLHFGGINVPTQPSSITNMSLSPVPAGVSAYTVSGQTIVFPSDGFVTQWWEGGNARVLWSTYPEPTLCDWYDAPRQQAQPSGMDDLAASPPGGGGYCQTSTGSRVFSTNHNTYLSDEGFVRKAPPVDFADQPYRFATSTWSGQPSDQTQVIDRARTELQTGKDQLAEAWYAAQLDPRNHDTGFKDDEDCDLSGGQGDPGPPPSGDPYHSVPESEFPQAGVPAVGGTVYLRWGLTSLNPDNREIDWRGWGYRKIVAKHGWTANDRAATLTALADAGPTVSRRPDGRERYTYLGPEYAGRNNARCQRVVGVDYDRTDSEVQNNKPAAGIVTSYGEKLR